MFDCTRATMFPIVIVAAARPAISGTQSAWAAGSAVVSTRISAANPAAFDATDRYADTAVGAPSYTSGVHIWNGTAETLKPKPASKSASARKSAAFGVVVTMAPIRSSLVLPDRP